MTNDELRLLWVRWLAAEPLTQEEQRLLAAALEEDAGLRDALLEDLDLDGALRGLAEGRRRSDEFERTMAAIVRPERDATRFVRKVEAALAGPASKPPSSTKLQAIRDGRTHRFTRRARQGEGGGVAWKVGLAAAALFALVVIAAVGRPAPPKGPPPPEIVKPRIEEPRGEEPAPESKRVRAPRPEPRTPAPVPAPEPKSERTETEPRKFEVPPTPKPEPDILPVPPANAPERPGSTTSDKAVAASDPATITEGALHAVNALTDTYRKGVLPEDTDLLANRSSGASIRWADGTTVDLQPATVIRLSRDPAARRVVVKGTIVSKIAKRPAEHPMIFETEDAHARILGTMIRLSADSLGTTLEVREGKVRFGRPGGKPVDVGAGEFAVAAPGVEPTAHVNLGAEELRFAFGPADTVLDRSRWKLDSGQAFAASRGYGWKPSVYPRQIWRNPTPDAGGVGAARTPNGKPDDLRTGHVAAGWGIHSDTWVLPLPNGRYAVRIGVGDSLVEHGPHRVVIEGTVVVADVITKGPGHYAEFQAEVTVRDGDLTMVVGGSESKKVPQDGSLDTILNTLVIKRLK